MREALWDRVVEMCKDGRAILVHSAPNEQHFDFRVHRHDWEVVDLDGLNLVRRPRDAREMTNPMRRGWSKAAKYRKAKRKN